MSKLMKFLHSPSMYFRDFFAKRCPEPASECGLRERDEPDAMDFQMRLETRGPMPAFPVDVVFTCVDGSDPQWRRERDRWLAKTSNAHPNGVDEARFKNFGEIKHAVMSCAECLPFARRIFIAGPLTGREEWLPPNAVVVRHEDFIPAEHLPTFNSHVIEAHLDRIPGLAEHFIYFNDDVFSLRNVPASHFFSAGGSVKLFSTVKSLRRMQAAGRSTPALSASLNCAALLRRQFGADVDMPLAHSRIPLLKSFYSEARRLFGPEIEAFLGNRFRTERDLNLATFLVPWLAYLSGRGEMSFDVCRYFDVNTPSAPLHYRGLLEMKGTRYAPHAMCCNTGSCIGLTQEREDAFRSFLADFFS